MVLGIIGGAVAPGGSKAHALPMGFCGLLLALLGVVGAARLDGLNAVGCVRPEASEPAAYPKGAVWTGLTLFAGFLILLALVRLSAVQAGDEALSQALYHRFGRDGTRIVKAISNAGGRDLILKWLPIVLLLLWWRGRARSLRFFAATMSGSLGLEAVFKALGYRARPDFTHRTSFDSFPSGHVLAATILAGALVVICIRTCKRPWQRGLLLAGSIAWPLGMAFARVYLGAHYPTDAAGGILLGAAWVLLCQALLLRIAAAPEPASAPQADTAEVPTMIPEAALSAGNSPTPS